MSHVPHELHDEFPADAPILHELKLTDSHFRKLSDSYHEVNRAIHRAETNVEPASGQMLEQMNYLAGIIRKAQQKKMIRSDFKAEHIADIFAAILSTVIVGLLKEKPSCFEDPKNISGYIFDLFMNGVGSK